MSSIDYRRVTLLVSCWLCIAVIGWGQDLRLSIVPEIQEQTADPRGMGVMVEAEDGADQWDQPEPPAAPGGCQAAAFVMPGYDGSLPNLWRCDYRSSDSFYSMRSLFWELRLCTGEVAMPVTLHVTALDPFPVDVEFWLHTPDGVSVLVPIPGSVTVEMFDPEGTVFLELALAGGVGSTRAAWSSIKASFR